jgi:hypothetical protein
MEATIIDPEPAKSRLSRIAPIDLMAPDSFESAKAVLRAEIERDWESDRSTL